MAVVCLMLVQDAAFALSDRKGDALSPASRFSPLARMVQDAEGAWKVVFDDDPAFQKDALFYYISILVGRYLMLGVSEHTIKPDIQDVIEAIKERLGAGALLDAAASDPILKGANIHAAFYSERENAFYLPIERNAKTAYAYKFHLERAPGTSPDMTIPLGDGSSVYITVEPAGDTTLAPSARALEIGRTWHDLGNLLEVVMAVGAAALSRPLDAKFVTHIERVNASCLKISSHHQAIANRLGSEDDALASFMAALDELKRLLTPEFIAALRNEYEQSRLAEGPELAAEKAKDAEASCKALALVLGRDMDLSAHEMVDIAVHEAARRSSRRSFEVIRDGGDTSLAGNRAELFRAILNIIRNARESIAGRGGEGKVTITIETRPTFVRIKVADNGPGFAPAAVSAFNDRGEMPASAKGEGHGLGIGIAHEMVERNGGHMNLLPNEGGDGSRGAKVIVHLPAGISRSPDPFVVKTPRDEEDTEERAEHDNPEHIPQDSVNFLVHMIKVYYGDEPRQAVTRLSIRIQQLDEGVPAGTRKTLEKTLDRAVATIYGRKEPLPLPGEVRTLDGARARGIVGRMLARRESHLEAARLLREAALAALPEDEKITRALAAFYHDRVREFFDDLESRARQFGIEPEGVATEGDAPSAPPRRNAAQLSAGEIAALEERIDEALPERFATNESHYRLDSPGGRAVDVVVKKMKVDDGESWRYGATYLVRVGHLFFIDDFVCEAFDAELKRDLEPNAIRIGQLQAIGKITDSDTDGPLADLYAWLMIAEMMRHDFTGTEVIDLGAGNGILSLVAWKLGASFLQPVDYDSKRLTAALKLFEINGLENGRDFIRIEGDIKKTAELAGKLRSRGGPVAVLSNIGHWPGVYPVTNADSMRLLDHIPQARLFIAGGYMENGKEKRVHIPGDQALIKERGFMVAAPGTTYASHEGLHAAWSAKLPEESGNVDAGDHGEALRALARDVAAIYGDVRQAYAGRGLARIKTDSSPVTLADYLVQVRATVALHALYPEDGIIAEEDIDIEDLEEILSMPGNEALAEKYGKDIGAYRQAMDDVFSPEAAGARKKHYWVMDPLDGTRGFAGGADRFAFSAARLAWNEETQLYETDRSIAYAPFYETTYRGVAVAGPLVEYFRDDEGGVVSLWVGGLDGKLIQADSHIRFERQQELMPWNIILRDPTTSSTGENPFRAEMAGRYGEERITAHWESSVVGMMEVLLGNYALFHSEMHLWDHAALSGMVRAAGGEIRRGATREPVEGYTEKDVADAMGGAWFDVIASRGGAHSIDEERRSFPAVFGALGGAAGGVGACIITVTAMAVAMMANDIIYIVATRPEYRSALDAHPLARRIASFLLRKGLVSYPYFPRFSGALVAYITKPAVRAAAVIAARSALIAGAIALFWNGQHEHSSFFFMASFGPHLDRTRKRYEDLKHALETAPGLEKKLAVVAEMESVSDNDRRLKYFTAVIVHEKDFEVLLAAGYGLSRLGDAGHRALTAALKTSFSKDDPTPNQLAAAYGLSQREQGGLRTLAGNLFGMAGSSAQYAAAFGLVYRDEGMKAIMDGLQRADTFDAALYGLTMSPDSLSDLRAAFVASNHPDRRMRIGRALAGLGEEGLDELRSIAKSGGNSIAAAAENVLKQRKDDERPAEERADHVSVEAPANEVSRPEKAAERLAEESQRGPTVLNGNARLVMVHLALLAATESAKSLAVENRLQLLKAQFRNHLSIIDRDPADAASQGVIFAPGGSVPEDELTRKGVTDEEFIFSGCSTSICMLNAAGSIVRYTVRNGRNARIVVPLDTTNLIFSEDPARAEKLAATYYGILRFCDATLFSRMEISANGAVKHSVPGKDPSGPTISVEIIDSMDTITSHSPAAAGASSGGRLLGMAASAEHAGMSPEAATERVHAIQLIDAVKLAAKRAPKDERLILALGEGCIPAGMSGGKLTNDRRALFNCIEHLCRVNGIIFVHEDETHLREAIAAAKSRIGAGAKVIVAANIAAAEFLPLYDETKKTEGDAGKLVDFLVGVDTAGCDYACIPGILASALRLERGGSVSPDGDLTVALSTDPRYPGLRILVPKAARFPADEKEKIIHALLTAQVNA